MSNYIVHSAGEPEDELYHARSHKYIKRYIVNGKWRYVYADDSTHQGIQRSASRAHHYELKRQWTVQDRTTNLLARGVRANEGWSKSKMDRWYPVDTSMAADYANQATRHYNEYANRVNNNSVSKKIRNRVTVARYRVNTIKNTVNKKRSR